MRIFVAGATGAVGRFLVPLLVDAGHEVTGMARTEEAGDRLRARGAAAVRGDVFDADRVREAIADAAPDVVMHQLTALSKGTPADNGQMRRVGTRILVDAAKQAGVTRIIAQSVAWAYEPGDTPAGEGTPLDVTAPPPRANLVGGITALEEAAAELPEHVVLRYGILYGPGTWYAPGGLVAERLAGRALDERATALVGPLSADDAVNSFVHVEDAAGAAVAALDWPSGVVNIVDDEPAPAREWLPVLADVLGAPAPVTGSGRAGWERGASNARARDSLGWRPAYPTWRTGFAATKES
ncbi:NAD-dependent epimerase/dehydratase family protein [Nonomuraea phyllanthi]|uniref:NAD-dependent epimerase/dehydratase family protein n=1 Tax=Nonomuraea phyllanthi TaxID=2219224 RepID=A0A5C4VVP3_9ACTN|nr:NAD(P)-dependent oxidoreductase [Nonomuraea phyllanthi]KAB8190326.1 NAD-dependent epimerase/dehydratase family protein [Nonomuraea phyllanthi]